MDEKEREEWEVGCWCGAKGMPRPEPCWLKLQPIFMEGYDAGRKLRTSVLAGKREENGTDG